MEETIGRYVELINHGIRRADHLIEELEDLVTFKQDIRYSVIRRGLGYAIPRLLKEYGHNVDGTSLFDSAGELNFYAIKLSEFIISLNPLELLPAQIKKQGEILMTFCCEVYEKVDDFFWSADENYFEAVE